MTSQVSFYFCGPISQVEEAFTSLTLFFCPKVLINFYDANTEAAIKDDIFRAKKLLEDRATLVSIKQQDYPELAKLWDAAEKSPSMILFKDGSPVTRIYEETFYLDIVARVGKFCETEV